MHYLHLRFENCGLISKETKNPEKDVNYIGEINLVNSKGHDLSNPIPYTLLSNVLHVLSGEIPVPTKRKTFKLGKRIKEFDDIALNSYIKYDREIEFDKFGKPMQAEIKQTTKSYISCGKKHYCKFYNKNNEEINFYKGDGSINEKLAGYYNWSYFRKGCKNKEDFFKFIIFLNSIVGYNVLDKTLDEAVTEISQYWEDDDFKEKSEVFIKENENTYNKCWFIIFFHKKGDTSNIKEKSSTALHEMRGITNITYLSGEIICKIENDDIVNKIYHGEGFATLLEGGLVYVLGIEKYTPYANIEEEFIKIK